ncbi:MAG: histidine--tRNA ligase [Chloroflexi bacterium]|nr:histidine--tRNA ligase [Chloroflexota bacterium]
MKTTFQQVKGTREFFPSQMAIRRWLYSMIERVSILYGYQEYDGPFLEKIELYSAKSGEELVKQQAFVFPDRGGELITLRPELTLSLARMVAEKQKELVYPIRWWSFGPFWRYERPQKGRTREFFQWNIDLIGTSSSEADAELISICAVFFRVIGINPEQVKILINDRNLMDTELISIGIKDDLRKEVFRIIDKRGKMKKEDWQATAIDAGLSQEQLEKLVTLLDNKDLWKKSQNLRNIFKTLENLGVSDFVAYEPQVIRGLDYYTGVVFEAWDVGGDGRAVLGGGHYDNLIGDVGGDALAGVGFAMGDVMITLLLEKYGKLPKLNIFEDTVLVTVFSEEFFEKSQIIATRLRNFGIKTILYPEISKLNKQLKFADRSGIKIVVVIGPDEVEKHCVAIKDLSKSTQEIAPEAEVEEKIMQLLAQEMAV